ncbi:META domain-containing protein [Chloroflexota bacterium]
MKKIFFTVVILMLLLSFGCNSQTDEVRADLGQEFDLYIGQTVFIEDEQISVKFVEVVTDSRCAEGATCIWQGEVTCIVEITYFESLHRKTLTQPGLTQEPSRDVFKEYSITFNVKPYPELEKDIKTNEYRLQLVIEKNLMVEGTKWFLRSYGEQDNLETIIEGTEITATFNTSEGQVGGSAGCNIYGGRYQITGSTLSISEIYFTEMACLSPEGVMQQEQEFLSILANAQSFQADDTTLAILCSGGQQLYFTTATRIQ